MVSRYTLKEFYPKQIGAQLYRGAEVEKLIYVKRSATDPLIIRYQYNGPENSVPEPMLSDSVLSQTENSLPGGYAFIASIENSEGENIPLEDISCLPLKGFFTELSNGEKLLLFSAITSEDVLSAVISCKWPLFVRSK